MLIIRVFLILCGTNEDPYPTQQSKIYHLWSVLSFSQQRLASCKLSTYNSQPLFTSSYNEAFTPRISISIPRSYWSSNPTFPVAWKTTHELSCTRNFHRNPVPSLLHIDSPPRIAAAQSFPRTVQSSSTLKEPCGSPLLRRRLKQLFPR